MLNPSVRAFFAGISQIPGPLPEPQEELRSPMLQNEEERIRTHKLMLFWREAAWIGKNHPAQILRECVVVIQQV
jgi:hypothetical protein